MAGSWILCGVAVMGTACLRAGEPPGTVRAASPAPTLVVRLYDYAGLPARTLDEFKTHAVKTLRDAGIDSQWVYCSAIDVSADPKSCNQALDQAGIVLRLLPKAPALPRGALGSSILGEDGTGVYGQIYLSAIRRFAPELEIKPSVLLSFAAIHEIGHLLDGPDHYLWGVMQPCWGHSQLRQLMINRSPFHPVHAKKLRARLAARASRFDAGAH